MLRYLIAIALAGGLFPALAADGPVPIRREEIIRNATPAALRFLDRATNPTRSERLSTREIFTKALTLCEAHTGVDRMDSLLAIAEPLQDRDKASPTYGNFYWYSDDRQVTDRNAVDFCMQGAAPLWIRHHDTLPPAARERLKKMIAFGIDGLMGHKVKPSYTNLALMNAGNLILLGEAMERPDAAEEGYARLDRFLSAMWESGTHEYNSPTYYGVDMEDLQLMAAFAKRERGKEQARTLLEFFWRDIALNWFPAAQKMAGARSRDYDYLSGLGMLDLHLKTCGWLPVGDKEKVDSILCAFTTWHPPAELWERAVSPKPRLVESIWGSARDQVRACWRCPDVVLSAAGSGYGGRMDFPLCVDLPGPRARPRICFVPDGRHDPCGKAKILEGGSGHMKALHLSPFWAASQRRCDALGLSVYRDGDLPVDTSGMESHIVMPRDVDEFWVGGERVVFDGRSADHALAAGQALVLRQGTAAVGIRVVWARDREGKDVSAHLVDDGNLFGVVRLTIDHRWVRGLSPSAAGAAFWIRVGSGLDTDDAFNAWRAAFAASAVEVRADAAGIAIRVAGQDGPLSITAAPPFTVATTVEPAWPRHLLACDGVDVGRRLLSELEPVKSLRERMERVRTGP